MQQTQSASKPLSSCRANLSLHGRKPALGFHGCSQAWTTQLVTLLVDFAGARRICREGHYLFLVLTNGQIFLLQASSPQISVELLIDGFLASGNSELIAAEMASEDKYSAGCLQGACMEETSDAIFSALSPLLTVFLIFVSP